MVQPARSATLASYHLPIPNDQHNLATSMPSLQPRHRQAHRRPSSSWSNVAHPHPSTDLDSVAGHSHQHPKNHPCPLAQQAIGYRHTLPAAPAPYRAVDQDAARQLRQWKAVRRQHGWAMDETVQAVCPQIPGPQSTHSSSSSPPRSWGQTCYSPSSTGPIPITTPVHTTPSPRHTGSSRRHNTCSYNPERGRQRGARCRGSSPCPLKTPPLDGPRSGPSSQPWQQTNPPLTRSSTLPLYKPLFPHDHTPSSSNPSTTLTHDSPPPTTRGLTVPSPNAVPGSSSSSGSSHSSVDTAGTSPSQGRTTTTSTLVKSSPPSPLPPSPTSFRSARTPTLPSPLPTPTQPLSLSPPARMRVSPAQPRAALSLAIASATLDASCAEPMQTQHATTVSRLAMVQAMHRQGTSEEVSSPLSQHVRGLAQQGTKQGLGARVYALAALEADSNRRVPSPPPTRPTRAPLHRTRSLGQARASRSPSLAVLLGSSSKAPRTSDTSFADVPLSHDASLASPGDMVTGLDTEWNAREDGASGQARAPLRISIDASDDPLQRNHRYCIASQASSPSPPPPNEWLAARLSNFHATLQGSRRTSVGSENDHSAVSQEETNDSAVTLRPGMNGLVAAEPLEPQPLGAPAPITSASPPDEDKVRNKPMGLLAVSLRQFSRLPNYLPNYFTPTAPTGVPAEPVVAETDVQGAWGECSPCAPPPQWGAWGGQMWSPPTDPIRTVPHAAASAPGSSKGRGVMTPWEADMSASAYVAGLGEPVDPDVELSSMVCLETYRLRPDDVPEEVDEPDSSDTARGSASESWSTSPPTPEEEEEQSTDHLLDPEALAHALQENLFHFAPTEEEPHLSASPPDGLTAPQEQHSPTLQQRSSRSAKLSVPSDEPSRGRSRSRTPSADRIRSSAPSSRTSPTTPRSRGQSPPAPRRRRLSAHDSTRRQSSPLPRRVPDELVVQVVHTRRRRSEVDAKNDHPRRSRPRRRPSSLHETALPMHIEGKDSSADTNRRPRRPRPSRGSSAPTSSSSSSGVRRTPSSSTERSIHPGRSCSPSFRPRLLANGQHLYMLSLELEMIRKNKITAPLKPRWGKERPRSRFSPPSPGNQVCLAARPPPLGCGCSTSDQSGEVRTAQLDRWRFASIAYVQSGLKNQWEPSA